MKCSNFRLTIHHTILSIHFITSYYKWVLSKGKGYCSTYLYKSKAAKHPMLFETAVDGIYCELHFPKQIRIKKSHHNTCPFGNKIDKKIVHQITEFTKGQCSKQKKKNILFMSRVAFSPGPWIKIILYNYICSYNAAFKFELGMWWLKKWTE